MALNSRVRASTQDAEPRMQEQTTGVDLPEGFYMRPTESVPPHIGEMIDRHVAANQAAYSGSPQPGLIVRLPSLEKLGVTCEIGVLLAQKTRQGTWRGWLAVGECDYAGVSDFVLQEEDGPFYSAFGMVQVWNPVEVKLPKRCDVLGTLSPDRMEAVYAMAREFKGSIAANAGPPFPGKVGLRKVGGYAVVTGTPLADPKDDPRWIYQRAYTGLARRLSQTSTSSAGALWAAAALKRSARALEQWTAGRQLAFTPQAVITHPLGQDADEPVNVGYRLEDLCELWLSIIESEGVIHVRVKRVGDAQLSVRLMRGDEPFLDEMLNQSQEEVQVSTEVDSGDVLILEDKSTQKTYSVPIT
ncbi:MAG TPA: hypothetical protein ENI68_11335 [Gammaproteobacteria bacterium]|nr:hypothetical protein [Gammaproteobacteria bacterium]